MKHTERILRYLDGKLSKKELEIFMEDIVHDDELREELEIHQLITSTVSQHDEQRFRKKLREAEAIHLKKGLGRNSAITFSRSGVYFGIALLLIVSGFFLFSVISSTPEKLYNKYYHKFSQELNSRAGIMSEQDLLSMGIYEYLNGDYIAGIVNLSLYIESNPLNHNIALFYRGLCYMEEEKFTSAIGDFSLILDENFNYYQEHSRWYLSLCYLKTKEYDKSLLNLLELKLENSVYSKKAVALIKKID